MSDIALLKEMIKETARVPLEEHNGKNQVTLIEPPPANYSVTIHGMPYEDEVIIIKVDTFSSPRAVFNGKCGECSRADFVIIADTDNKKVSKVILFIEMKGGKAENKKIIQQLKGAQCFVAYCREIGQLFWEQKNFLKDYKYRFISLKKISIAKKTTWIGSKVGIHNSPERMLKITSPHHLQFNRLVNFRTK